MHSLVKYHNKTVDRMLMIWFVLIFSRFFGQRPSNAIRIDNFPFLQLYLSSPTAANWLEYLFLVYLYNFCIEYRESESSYVIFVFFLIYTIFAVLTLDCVTIETSLKLLLFNQFLLANSRPFSHQYEITFNLDVITWTKCYFL